MTPGIIEKLAAAASKPPDLLSEYSMGKHCGGNLEKKSEEDKQEGGGGFGGAEPLIDMTV